MPQVNVYTEPAAKPADIPLRVYSNPICPFAQVRRRLGTRAFTTFAYGSRGRWVAMNSVVGATQGTWCRSSRGGHAYTSCTSTHDLVSFPACFRLTSFFCLRKAVWTNGCPFRVWQSGMPNCLYGQGVIACHCSWLGPRNCPTVLL